MQIIGIHAKSLDKIVRVMLVIFLVQVVEKLNDVSKLTILQLIELRIIFTLFVYHLHHVFVHLCYMLHRHLSELLLHVTCSLSILSDILRRNCLHSRVQLLQS